MSEAGSFRSFLLPALAGFLLIMSAIPENIGENTQDDIIVTTTSPPDYVYLTYASSDTAHTINVSWCTDENYVGEVRYDNEPRGGDPGAYSYSENGTGGVTTDNLEGYFHHVELTGFQPDTVYYFICGKSSAWSDERSFQTAPDQRSSFRFAAGGDSRTDGRYEFVDWPEARDNVSDLMAHYNPPFALFIGDFLWRGDDPGSDVYDENDTWDNWLGAIDAYWNTSDNRMIPLIPVIGNHELYPPYPQPTEGDYYPDHGFNYYTVFNLPGNERWYALDWGPDLRIIVLDSEVLDESSDAWAEQYEWLENELQSSQNYIWKVATFHRPAIRYSYTNARLENWGYLFAKYDVDLVLSGHIHWYERTYPIDETGEVTSLENGFIQVISGGWGSPLSTPGAHKEYDAYDPDDRYHFLLTDILDNGILRVRAIDIDNNVFDEFSIYKPRRCVDVSIMPDENYGQIGENINFVVKVKNIGMENDSYLLTVEDNADWPTLLSEDLLENMVFGEARTVILTVTIPDNEKLKGAKDVVNLTATSQENVQISNNASCIAYALEEFTLQLDVGWNLISIPLRLENQTRGAIFKGVAHGISGWTGTAYYTPWMEDNLEPGEGYWVWVPSATMIGLSGVSLEKFALDLDPGWNLIGIPKFYPSLDNRSRGAIFEGVTHGISGWTGTGYYTPWMEDNLEPGEGYWVWVPTETEITLSAG